MLAINNVYSPLGEVARFHVTLTDRIAGIQFDINYNPDLLYLVGFYPTENPRPAFNIRTPGIIHYLVMDLNGLPELLITMRFRTRGEDTLTFSDVIASDSLGGEVEINTQNGAFINRMDVVHKEKRLVYELN